MVLVVLDGVDASGKSTQAEKLCRCLREHGRTFCLRIHPSGDNLFGVKARSLLLMEGRGAYVATSLFYMLDVVRSILLYSWRRVDFVVFVRYLMGTAYLPSPLHRIAYHIFVRLVPTSDLMFFLRVSAREAHRRMEKKRRRRERFETLEELVKVGDKALTLASTGKWIIVDGDRPEEKVHEEIRFDVGLA